MLRLIDGKNQSTTWNYDEYGRVTNKLDANTTEILRYKYDPNDRLTNRWCAGKGTTVYRYDPIGNLTNVDYSGGTVSTPSIYYAYDGLNRLTSMADGVGTTTFGWTDGDQLARETGPWANDTVSYTYNSRLRSNLNVQAPNASAWSQTYGYDAAMRLTNITSLAGSFGYTYLYDGSYASDLTRYLSLPGDAGNTFYIENQYDGMARLTNTTLNTPLLGLANRHQYVYDAGSERTKQVFTAGNFMNYTYDAIGQLKTAKGFEPGGVTNRLHEQFGYTYDAAWNLAQRTNDAVAGVPTTFQYNNLNELTNVQPSSRLTVAGLYLSAVSVVSHVSSPPLISGIISPTYLYVDDVFASAGWPSGGPTNYVSAQGQDGGGNTVFTLTNKVYRVGTYTYDANGNVTSETLPGVPGLGWADTPRRSFAYDDENQLVSVWITNNWRSDFAYDGLLRRRCETNFTWSGSAWLPTGVVHYIYDGNLVVQERDGNNLPLTTYTRGIDLSGTLQGAGGIGGLLARTDNGQVISQIAGSSPATAHAFYHADGNGNITALVNSDGLVVARYNYDPFGTVLVMSGPLAGANRYRFSSKEWNDNAGIYYYGFRYYEPNLQRWLNRDPIQEGGGINLFRFLFNAAMTLVDPFGLCDGDNLPDWLKNASHLSYDLPPSQTWPPPQRPLVPPAPSKHPLQDSASKIGQGLWDQYGEQSRQEASNIASNLGIDKKEQLGLLGVAAAGAAAGLYFNGDKVQSPDFPITKHVNVSVWIQQNKDIGKPNNQDPLPIQGGCQVNYSFP